EKATHPFTILSASAFSVKMGRKQETGRFNRGSEGESRAQPGESRRAGSGEGGLRYRKLSARRGQGARDEPAGGGERGRAQLRDGVVVSVEQVADLADDLQPVGDAQVPAQIDDGVTRRGAGTQVVRAVR